MGISSLGVGSSILTQDVLDQLRKADEAGRITPITLDIANENDKKDAFKIIDATMTNFIDSINAVKTASLWDGRKAEVTSGTSVEVSAISKTDVQDFSLEVTQLATKQIEQSGIFDSATAAIDTGGTAGSFTIQVGGSPASPIAIEYDAGATLTDIKKLINEHSEAGDLVDASIVQLKTGEYHLMLSSKETGASSDISMTGVTGSLDTKLTTGSSVVQSGLNSKFKFNGSTTEYERPSNKIDDLITGLTININSLGTSEVSIAQDRTSILEKFDSFVEKYNSAITELDKMTKPSVESDERGIFSSDSTIKSMKRAIQDMFEAVGGGVGSMIDYGFAIDKDGKMSLDKTVLEKGMDSDLKNVQAFFSGGDFTKTDGTIVAVTGTFAEMSTTIEGYTKTNQILDQLKEGMSTTLKSLEERKESATERLDAKYEIMKKQYAAYDLIISQFNSASSMFSQMINAENNAS